MVKLEDKSTGRLRASNMIDLSQEEQLAFKKHMGSLSSWQVSKPVLAEMERAFKQLVEGRCYNFSRLLPLMYTLRDKPYTLSNHFPFEPMYSTIIASDMIYKCGRQVAKCVPLSDDPVIWMADGRLASTRAISVGDEVISIGADYRRKVRKVLAVHKTGRKLVYRVETRLGACFEHTAEHKVRTLHGYTRVSDLCVGSRVAGVRLGGTFGTLQKSKAKIILTACIIGDGCCGLSNILNVTSECEEVLETCARLGQPFQARDMRISDKEGTHAKQVNFSVDCDSLLVQWMKKDKLWGKYSYEKSIPDWVFQLTRQDTRLFVSWLWATDGSIKPDRTITYSSSSNLLAKQVKSLLAKFGILASIDRKETPCRPSWLVRVETRDGRRKFFEQFDVPGKPPFELPTSPENNNRDTIPQEIQETLHLLTGPSLHKHEGSLRSAKLRATLKYPLSRTKLASYLEHFKKAKGTPAYTKLENLAADDVVWDEVTAITRVGFRETVDFEVEEDHNYAMDGVYTHNSSNLAVKAVSLCGMIPFFNVLCVCPLFETVRRFSNNYVKSFIEQSPLSSMFRLSGITASVLQRGFPNHSNMFFSYAYTDADRTRGLNTNMNLYDEVQDMDESFFPVIRETMGGSPYGYISVYSGTPKTTDNAIQKLFDESSMGEWVITCPNCKYDNVAALRYDLDDMMGPAHSDISEERPGLVCARGRCKKPINPRLGRWWHENPDNLLLFPGYHIPQQIMPMHCCDPDKWRQLMYKREGGYNTPINVFYNEVCGESYTSGSKLLTVEDLKRAATGIGPNTIENGVERALRGWDKGRKYRMRVLSVDWGGGGIKGDSWTVYAVLGLRADGKIDVIYGHRSLTPHDRDAEAQLVLRLMAQFRCHYFVHDYCGAGAFREEYVIKAGFPVERTMPIWYIRGASQHLMQNCPETESHWRNHWKLDKPRSLSLTCQLIKHGWISFFDYDHKAKAEKGLLWDFLALVEDKVDTRLGREIYTIIRAANQSDDFAHAVNMGVCAMYFRTGWPNVTEAAKFIIDAQTASWFNTLETYDHAMREGG